MRSKPSIAPCQIVIVVGFFLAMAGLGTIKPGYAKEIPIKLGSLAPAGTSVAVAVGTFWTG